eukprot:SAG22_NODE_164_length_16817_cov_61.573573_9_plen_101_part_00
MLVVCKWRGYLDKCWPGWSKEALTNWGQMLRLGAAGTISLMGEWWSWEMASGMAAMLGPIQLAAHAVLLNVGFIYFVCEYVAQLIHDFPCHLQRACRMRV